MDKFAWVSRDVVELVKISDLTEWKDASPDTHTKTYTFLRWDDILANPSQYIFQLKNDSVDRSADPRIFIKTARMIAFGFCTVQI